MHLVSLDLIDIVNAKPDSVRKQFDRLMEDIRKKACIDEEGLNLSGLDEDISVLDTLLIDLCEELDEVEGAKQKAKAKRARQSAAMDAYEDEIMISKRQKQLSEEHGLKGGFAELDAEEERLITDGLLDEEEGTSPGLSSSNSRAASDDATVSKKDTPTNRPLAKRVPGLNSDFQSVLEGVKAAADTEAAKAKHKMDLESRRQEHEIAESIKDNEQKRSLAERELALREREMALKETQARAAQLQFEVLTKLLAERDNKLTS
jgi:hypothetical protein